MSLLLLSNLILFLAGLCIMEWKPKFLIIYYSAWTIFAPYFYDLFIENLPAGAFSTFEKYANLLIYFTSLYYIFKFRHLSYHKKIVVIVFCIFLLFLLFLSLYRGTTSEFFTFMIQCFAWVPLFFTLSMVKFDINLYRNYAIILIFIQCLLVYFQYIHIGEASYQLQNELFYSPCGTYYRYNYLASNLAPILLFILLSRWSAKESLSIIDYCALFVGGLCVYFSGARTELMAFVIAVVIAIYYKYANQKTIVFVATSIAMILIAFYDKTYVAVSDYGATITERNYNILAVLNGDMKYLTDSSTFGISYVAAIHFFSDIKYLPIGIGKFYDSVNGYAYLRPETITDATLMFYILETGLIGFLFLICLIWCITKQNNILFRWKILFVFYFLFCTFTDLGIFHAMDTLFLLLLCRFTDVINNYENLRLLYKKRTLA